jgi:hypothetical protein
VLASLAGPARLRDGARLEGGEDVREAKTVVGDAVLPRKSHALIDEAPHPGCQPPTNAARRRVQTRPTASAVLGGAVRDTPYPEPGKPMATLGHGLPRIVCVCLGSARQLAGLNVVRRLPLRSLMEWAVVLFPVLSAAAGYLLHGVHVQDIARAFAK